MEEHQKGQEEAKADDKGVRSPGRRPLEGRIIRGTKSRSMFVGVH